MPSRTLTRLQQKREVRVRIVLLIDPLTVLGLVANLVQLVDAAASAVRLWHEVHSLRASRNDTRMTYTSGNGDHCYADLQKFCKDTNGDCRSL